MSVKNENAAAGASVVLERPAAGGVYASLFEKINLNPVSELSALDIWQDAQAMSDATADERLTAGMQVFLECLTKSGSKVEKLDKNLIDHHIAEELWERIRNLLKETAPDAAVLTCMYRTLQLGFVGQYRAQDDERREDIVRALAERVPAFTLAQDAPIVGRASRLRSGRRWYWLTWAVAAIALAALWFVLSSSLTELVSQTVKPG